jgi:hypothetical protein
MDAEYSQKDSLGLSLLRGRVLVVMASILTFQQAFESFWAKVGPLMANGVSFEDAIIALDAAGPMLAASNDLLIMAMAGIAAFASAFSKLRELWRIYRNKQLAQQQPGAESPA